MLPPYTFAATIAVTDAVASVAVAIAVVMHCCCHYPLLLPLLLLSLLLRLSPLLLPVAATTAVDVSFIIAATFGVTEAAFIPPYNYLPLTMVRKTTINLYMCLWLNFNHKLDNKALLLSFYKSIYEFILT